MTGSFRRFWPVGHFNLLWYQHVRFLHSYYKTRIKSLFACLRAELNVIPVIITPRAKGICTAIRLPQWVQRPKERQNKVVHIVERNIINWKRCAFGKFLSGLKLSFITVSYNSLMASSQVRFIHHYVTKPILDLFLYRGFEQQSGRCTRHCWNKFGLRGTWSVIGNLHLGNPTQEWF